MNPLVVIPTYISSRHSVPSDRNDAVVYDHTTPLMSEGELPRCLKSLNRVRGVGAVAVLVAQAQLIISQMLQRP